MAILLNLVKSTSEPFEIRSGENRDAVFAGICSDPFGRQAFLDTKTPGCASDVDDSRL